MSQPVTYLSGQIDNWKLLASGSSNPEFYDAWMRLLVQQTGGAQEAVLVMGKVNTGPFKPVSFWPQQQSCGEELQQVCEQVLDMRIPITHQSGSLTLYALPIAHGDDVYGVVALALTTTTSIEPVRYWVNWGTGWLIDHDTSSDSASELNERLMVFLDIMMSAIDEQDISAACQTVVTEAAVRLACDRVSLGFGVNDDIKMVAISNAADFARQIDVVHALESVMNETADQGQMIIYTPDLSHDEDESSNILVTREHQSLQVQSGNRKILSVPFYVKEDQYGVFVFEWPDIDSGEMEEKIAAGIPPILGRVLLEKRESQLPLYKIFWKGLLKRARHLYGPRHTLFKIIFTLLLIAALFLVFARGEFRVTADSALEGGVRRFIVAPYDGYVASASARAGQVVDKGDVMAKLDDRDFKLEYSRWQSQKQQYVQQAHDAEANQDRAQVQIAMAQSEQASAQRALSKAMIDRSVITAPFSGLVVSGDLSQHLGSAVRKGATLFEIAPLDSYRIVLNVEEQDISYVKLGQRGELVLSALSDDAFPFTVSLVTPVAFAEEGENYFRVEATLDDMSAQLRPGMEGIAKISVDERRLIWIWTYRMMNYLRLKAWSFFGI